MKRFLLVLIAAAMIAWAIWFGMRVLHKPSSTAVAAFLPRETVFFAHLADFNAARGQWRETDLHKLLHEPAMQEFLQKPLSTIPRSNEAQQKLKQIEELEMKDAFLAVTSIANNDVKVLGGFRFKGTSQDVEQRIGRWRAKLLATFPNAKRETIDYQQRKIETSAQGTQMLATVYDGNWFLAANDLAGIKMLMDRVDGRLKDQENTLAADGAFRSASTHMPANRVMFFYLQPKPLVEKLVALRAATANPATPAQVTLLEKMQSVCGAFGFDGGKMRDVSFVGTPKFSENRVLARSSLALGTKDTFFYGDKLVTSGQMPDLSDPNALNAFPAPFKNMVAALSAAGIKKEDWQSAFDPEIGLLADWGAQARWPSVLATLPVKDSAKAKRIITTLTTGATEDVNWTQQEKDGALYFSMQSAGGFVSVTPVIAVSDHVVIAGLETASVEAAIKRSGTSSSELANSQNYANAARALPEPDQAFGYIDAALLYTRFDATLRPMLLMGAMFLPKVAEYVDLSKWPPADVITKHLSPIVTSTYYKNDGYVTESIGPVTFTQAAVGAGAIVGASVMAYKRQGQLGGMGGTPATPPLTQPVPLPNPTPAPTPAKTP
jgi:hypothetical protein